MCNVQNEVRRKFSSYQEALMAFLSKERVSRPLLHPYWLFINCRHSCFAFWGKILLKNGLLPHHLLSLLMIVNLILMLNLVLESDLSFRQWISKSQIINLKPFPSELSVTFDMSTRSYLNPNNRQQSWRAASCCTVLATCPFYLGGNWGTEMVIFRYHRTPT